MLWKKIQLGVLQVEWTKLLQYWFYSEPNITTVVTPVANSSTIITTVTTSNNSDDKDNFKNND